MFILWALAEKKTAELIQTALMDESVTASFYEPKALFRNQAYLSSLANALYELQEKYDVALLPESEGLDRSWPVNKIKTRHNPAVICWLKGTGGVRRHPAHPTSILVCSGVASYLYLC